MHNFNIVVEILLNIDMRILIGLYAGNIRKVTVNRAGQFHLKNLPSMRGNNIVHSTHLHTSRKGGRCDKKPLQSVRRVRIFYNQQQTRIIFA